MKRLSSLLAGLLMAASLLVALPGSALAYDHTNYAGRADTCSRQNPACGGTYNSSCHWTIYGKVDGRDVLFGPNHCFGDYGAYWGAGNPVYNGAGVRLGVIAYTPTIATNADMTWMWLDTGQKPYDKNEIIINGGSWSISQKIPNSGLTCNNLLAGTGGPLGSHTFKVSYWTETYGYEGPFLGGPREFWSEDHGGGRCLIDSGVPFTAGSRHVPSGAPYLDASIGGGGFLGDATDCNQPGCPAGSTIRFNSWRQAIIDLNAYYAGGAWFCANDACS